MTRHHLARGSTYRLSFIAVQILLCWLCPLHASAQDDEQDSSETMAWWVVGAGGIFDAYNSDGDTLSGTIGQVAIDSTGAEDSTYGKIIYHPSAGWSYPRTIANLGFWLPKTASENEQQNTPPSTGAGSAFALTNLPNPFKTVTTISYELPAPGHIRLRIYNAAGDQVRLLSDEVQSAGVHQIVWDGSGDNGEKLASGAYYCTLELMSDGIMNAVETRDRRGIYLAK